MLSDIDFKIPDFFLNVKDNSNVIVLYYYGKCLKYKKEKTDTPSKVNTGDAKKCLEAVELGSKQFLLSIQIERPEVSGKYQQDICTAAK